MSGDARRDSSGSARGGGSRPGILRVLVRIEALKTTKRLAFWVTTGIFAAFNAVFAMNSVQMATRRPNASFALPDSWPEILQLPQTSGPSFSA